MKPFRILLFRERGRWNAEPCIAPTSHQTRLRILNRFGGRRPRLASADVRAGHEVIIVRLVGGAGPLSEATVPLWIRMESRPMSLTVQSPVSGELKKTNSDAKPR